MDRELAGATRCVAYAAKSTEDIRGSIPAQLEDCRVAAGELGGRIVVAEFSDEAVSGYKRSRGAGLEAAVALSGKLAAREGVAELWVQHSDRLARGDGKTARHVVEIALWALKANVRVRSVQDPDTFRDLLYAVVSGQRNHEDSRRRSTASAAGRKRAAARGDYSGYMLDGYRIVVEVVDERRGRVRKRLAIDPERQALFEMIFRLARKGRSSGAIARAVNRAGWRTVPRSRRYRVMTFTDDRVRQTLANPRYAGLSPYGGEILGVGHWPAYISPRDFFRLKELRDATGHPWLPRPDYTPAPYLMARLAVCGRCGSGMFTATGDWRIDGTRSRRYCCSRRYDHRCRAPRIDAAVADAVLVANLHLLMGFESRSRATRHAGAGAPQAAEASIEPGAVHAEQLKSQVGDALRAGDHDRADKLLTELVEVRRWLESSQARTPTLSDPGDPDQDLLPEFYAWCRPELEGRGENSTTEAQRLNRILRGWYEHIALEHTGTNLRVLPETRRLPLNGIGVEPVEPDEAMPAQPVTVDLGAWQVALHRTGVGHRRGERWTDAELTHALRTWANEHGRSPKRLDWAHATPQHPSAVTIYKRWHTWEAGLHAAGLKLAARNMPTRDAAGHFNGPAP